jgi:hypothetical protein
MKTNKGNELYLMRVISGRYILNKLSEKIIIQYFMCFRLKKYKEEIGT